MVRAPTSTSNGHKVQVQVAAKGAWQIDDADRCTTATIEHIILVDVTNGRRELYVCPGDKLRADVRRRLSDFFAIKGGTDLSQAGAEVAQQLGAAEQVTGHTVLDDALASRRTSRYRAG
jgi:hypothetical protein